jgi:hypothetical protein
MEKESPYAGKPPVPDEAQLQHLLKRGIINKTPNPSAHYHLWQGA